MSISATLSNNAGLQSSIGSVSQVRGSVSQGNEVVVTRVTIPGPAGPQGAAGSSENIIAQYLLICGSQMLFLIKL